jgi:hypothetical protein
VKVTGLFAVLVLLFVVQANGQASAKLKLGDRPVFMSSQRLALYCDDWNSLNPGGKPPTDSDVLNVSPQQIARSMACEAYILGVMDRGLEEKFGPRYHPAPSVLDYLKPLIDTFLKYVNDHPEEESLAASTVLLKAESLIAQAQTPEKEK